MSVADEPDPALAFLAGGGEMGARIRAHDWSESLGEPRSWPQSLRSAMSICLHSSFPTAIYWGAELRLLYNDAWRPVAAERHPRALGRPGVEVWSDIWSVIDAQFAQVLRTGEGFSTYDQLLPMVRGGVVQETYWNYSLTPIRGEDGTVAGVFNQGHETTERVLGERRSLAERDRLRFLAALDDQLRTSRDPAGVMHAAAALLARHLGTSRTAYADVDDDNDRFSIRDDYTAAGVDTSIGSYSLDLFGPRAAADMRGGSTLVIRDVAAELAPGAGRDMFRSIGIEAIVCCPLLKDGRLAAMMAVHQDAPRDWQPEEIALVEAAVERCWAYIERAGAEARLREMNETLEERVSAALAERKILSDLFETTTAFVQILDRDYRFLAVNKASADEYGRVFGFRPSAGDNLLDLLRDTPQREPVHALWRRVLAGETFSHVAEMGEARLGRAWYDMKFAPVLNAASDIIGASLFGYDVTGRVHEQQQLAATEAARREADALYRAYFEHTAEALFVVGIRDDGGFSIEELNPTHERLTGLSTDALKGKPIEEQLPADVVDAVSANFRRAVAEGQPISYREVVDLPSGRRHWDTILVPVDGPERRVTRIIGSSRDVTARVQAEEQLRQSQKLEAMGSLTGGVSHDFNNLLTPIIGALDLLQRKDVGGDREKRLIDGALQSAERARVLVQRLLAFARRQPLQAVSVDIAELVNGMAGLIGSTLGPQIKIVVEVGDDLPVASADPNQLEMALLNLAVNARDAMPDGGTLRITARGEDVVTGRSDHLAPGRYVRLSVADTGIGMEAETLKRAVEPFFSTKGIGKGTGLGLSMVHGLAAQLGGELTIASRPALGTNVELWLPVGSAPAASSPTGGRDAAAPRRNGTALLVDDEPLVRATTADMLAELGFTVVEAGSAEEALDAIDRGLRPDVIVTDHLMTGRSGSELAAETRGRFPDLPVLLVSGYADVAGVDPDLPRLVKPFRQVDLAARLAELTGR
ncbi:PAS domain-containing protein [Sphingomonas corticis]|jgi:PAS domain S-box-containing protein|uniref:histidine kinase n=1 Tax=Sphingomonas corticis TaxID=2722791 RepID=A0ABX1CNX2_9SPHN|nr:PAS domain-containing protein [Sphingomonas corticis]NJR79656.1 PAS domain-containing protein [Sphingomonas corticis]